MNAGAVSGTAAGPWVVCLCAGWCNLCTSYRDVFARVARQLQAGASGLRFAWLDVEDEAEMVGDLDIENFPTILIADASGVLFFGPLTPHAQTLSRLVTSLQAEDAPRSTHSAVTRHLLTLLPASPEHWI